MSPIPDVSSFNAAARVAIARVLGAESEARAAVERARLSVGEIAESARLQARAVSERSERRIRRVVAAFERELATRLAEIDAEAARLAAPQPLARDERVELERQVRALALALVAEPAGAPP